MPHEFRRLIFPASDRIDDINFDELVARFKIDDARSEVIPAGTVFLFQFWAHWCFDSFRVDDKFFNRYDAQADGSFGVYPSRNRMSPLIDHGSGKFVLDNGSLPLMVYDGSSGTTEISPDPHRVNDNPPLKAFHLLAAKHHNKRIDAGRDYDTAKAETVATFNHLFLQEGARISGIKPQQILRQKVPGITRSLEFVFAAGRWAHAMIPNTVHGEPLFTHKRAKDVDLHKLFDMSEMARDINLGVSPAMTNMIPVPDPKSILVRTLSERHVKLGLPCFQDLARRYHIDIDKAAYPVGMPIWAGILLEAEMDGSGRLGPVGGRVFADALAGTLLWAKNEGAGLYHPRWNNAPTTTEEIIEYCLS
jgi:hypothetical protein